MGNSLTYLCELIKTRVNADFDFVIAITGVEGIGKSSCAYQIAKRVDKKFKLSKNFVFSPRTQDAIAQVKALHRYGAIVMDEGIKMAYKLEWHSKAQRMLNKVYTLNRNENKITIICIPNFNDLNKFFREHRIFFWIHVFARGKAAVFLRLDNPFSSDIWQMDKNNRFFLKGGKKLLISTDSRFNRLKKTTNYLMQFNYRDIPTEDRLEYIRLKNLYKYEDFEDETESKRQQNIAILCSHLKELGVPTKDIAKLIGKTVRTINRYCAGKTQDVDEVLRLSYINKDIKQKLPIKDGGSPVSI